MIHVNLSELVCFIFNHMNMVYTELYSVLTGPDDKKKVKTRLKKCSGTSETSLLINLGENKKDKDCIYWGGRRRRRGGGQTKNKCILFFLYKMNKGKVTMNQTKAVFIQQQQKKLN